jgi:hypothetical protein
MSRFFSAESSSCGKTIPPLASWTEKTENKSLVSNGEYHGDTFFSMCLLQFLLLRLLLILLPHHRRWDWLYKWVPLQQTLMVKNLLSLLLDLPLGRNIWKQ